MKSTSLRFGSACTIGSWLLRVEVLGAGVYACNHLCASYVGTVRVRVSRERQSAAATGWQVHTALASVLGAPRVGLCSSTPHMRIAAIGTLSQASTNQRLHAALALH